MYQFLWIAAHSWAFTMGLVHTLFPCEDKAIFCFNAFGVAKNVNDAIKIVVVYALGLMIINNLLGLGFSVLGTAASFLPSFQLFARFIAPVVSITIGSILYFRIVKYNKGDEHLASPISLKVHKNMVAVFLLGLFTGLPPCPVEIAVYIQAFTASSDFVTNGIFHVLFFSIGNIIGLFILTIVVTSVKRMDIFKQRSKDALQKAACWIMIGYGAIALLLALIGIDLFFIPE